MGLVVHTPRLQLQPLSIDLFPSLHHANYFPAHLHKHLQNLSMNDSLYGWGPWIIFSRDTNEVIGDIGFKDRPCQSSTVEVGYGICQNYRRRGFATEALKAMITYLFETCGILKVTAECRHDNTGSIRVLENSGMLRTVEHLQMIHWQLSKEQYYCQKNRDAARISAIC
jgi:[ribosomal protein S5]-alanine N-acetyltransferase